MIRVLIVDDEKLVRKGFIAMLPWAQFDMAVVGEAVNGEKALEFIAGNGVDLLFTDITMPVMSGIDLIKEVRRRYPDIWIVILTCHQDFSYIQEVLRLGAIDYIVKTQLEMEPVEEILRRIAGRVKNNGRNKPPSDLLQVKSIVFNKRFSEEVYNCIVNSVAYIESNLVNGISQDEAAKKANMSKGYFSHCFHEIVGKPFVEYVREAKMAKAKELLAQSSRPVYWIAEQLGFRDEKYFSKIFREYSGMLPSEYRNQSLG